MVLSQEVLEKIGNKSVPLRLAGGEPVGTAVTRVEDGQIVVDCEIDARLTYVTADTGFTYRHKFTIKTYDLEDTNGA